MPRRGAPAPTAAPRRHLVTTLWGGGLLLALGVHLLRLDRVCGLYWDDAWYVILAKALATGHGYTLINGPTPGVRPYFPPGFPWLLSFLFRVAPAFPDNVWLLKSVSIAAALGIAVLARRHAEHVAGLAAPLAVAVALATALHPALVFLATSTVMSEGVFTLVQLAVVLLVEQVVRRRGPGWLAPGAGALAGFAFLVRSLGVVLAFAAGAYLVKERRGRAAAAFALGAVLTAGPWLWFTRSHLPTPAERAEMNDAILLPYGEQFWLRSRQDPSEGTISAGELPARMWDGVGELGGTVAGALVVYPMYEVLEPGGWQGPAPGGTAVAVAVSVVVAIGFVVAVRRRVGVAEILLPLTAGAVILWQTQELRLMLPLLPFVLCYAALGLEALARAVGWRAGGGLALAAMGLVLAVSVAAHATYVARLYGPREQRPVFVQLFDELLTVVTWARDHVPPDQVLATNSPGLVYLYAGHPTIGYADPNGTWDEWRRLGVHYFVETSYFGHLSSLAEGRFTTVYRSPQIGMRVLDLERIYAPH